MGIKGINGKPVNVQNLKTTQAKPKENAEKKVQISGGDEGVKKEWLIIYYGAADNNLTDYLYSDMNEIENVGSDSNTHIVAFFDAGKKKAVQSESQLTQNQAEKAQDSSLVTKNPPYTLPTPFEGAKIFYLRKDNNPKQVTSEVLADLGQVNSADPKFMADVIASIMEKYPAKHVAVIISDHGGAWAGAVEDEHPKEKFMSVKEISQALAEVVKRTGRKIDLLGWDACIMASGEVAYALRPYAKIMVASEDYEGGDGWPYPNIFAKDAVRALQDAMNMRITVSPEDFAGMIVNGASHSPDQIKTLSAMDLTKADQFAKMVDNFAKAILKTDDENIKKVKNYFRNSEFIGYWGMKQFIDIFDFARRIAESKDITDANLKKAAKELFQFRKQFIIHNFRNESAHPNAYGVQLEARDYKVTKPEYQALAFAKDTAWDEAVKRIGYTKQEIDAMAQTQSAETTPEPQIPQTLKE